MTKRRAVRLVALLLAGVAIFAGWRAWPSEVAPADWTPLARLPRIRPDYTGVAIPPNIAPLNFVIEEPGTAYYVRIGTTEGPHCDIHSRDGAIRIPIGPWQELLAHYRGKLLPVEVYVRDEQQLWQRLNTFSWTVAQEEIDSHLVYRLLDPIFNKFKYLGIYQRDLESYEESPILFNSSFGRGSASTATRSHRTARTRFSSMSGPASTIRWAAGWWSFATARPLESIHARRSIPVLPASVLGIRANHWPRSRSMTPSSTCMGSGRKSARYTTGTRISP